MTAHATSGPEDGRGGEDEHRAAPPRSGGRLPLGWTIVLMAVAAGVLYFGLPRLAGLEDTWGRLSSGDPLWLCAAALLEVAAYAAYVFTFHRLFAEPGSRIGWRESYDISLAGVVASRVFATAGAGGIALSVWALDRSGMDRRQLVTRLTSFYVLIYGIFMAALVVVGTALRTGVLDGPAPFGLTVVPAIFGGIAIVAGLAAARVLPELGRRVRLRIRHHERVPKWVAPVADSAELLAAGVRAALHLVRTRDPAVVGAFCWWAFDVGVLWGCFQAFGEPPPGGVLVMGYLAGTLGNVLPLPGGLGGVEGAMIGAFMGFDVDGGLAVTAVLGYRACQYWLPIIPGALAYLRLLRTVRSWDASGEPSR
jgi:putative heme transporter